MKQKSQFPYKLSTRYFYVKITTFQQTKYKDSTFNREETKRTANRNPPREGETEEQQSMKKKLELDLKIKTFQQTKTTHRSENWIIFSREMARSTCKRRGRTSKKPWNSGATSAAMKQSSMQGPELHGFGDCCLDLFPADLGRH